jgi:hypothetical protein
VAHEASGQPADVILGMASDLSSLDDGQPIH